MHGQKALLERDINKRESLAGRRRDSVAIDSKRSKGHVHIDQTMQVLIIEIVTSLMHSAFLQTGYGWLWIYVLFSLVCQNSQVNGLAFFLCGGKR